MINNIISKSKEIIHEIWKDKRKRYVSLFTIFTICFFLFDLGSLLKNVWTNLMGLSDYTEEVKSVVLKSDGYDDKTPGSYQVTKSAKWTSDKSAKITFDVDTNVKYEEKNLDIILVIDISGSMEGARIEQVRIDTLDLVESALSTGNNRVALIEFATLSNIVSDFTTDSDLLLSELENLEIDTSIVENKVTENGQTTIYQYQGVTNYYRALLSVDEILSDYQQTSNREVVVVFLTDGIPCYETPNEVGQYKALKEKYPYITIQGIQYEMGYTVLDEVKNISDKQYIANMITLNDVLFKSVEAVEYYDTFEIVDYINNDYYYVESKDDIKVPFGSVTLTEEDGVQKITWTVPDNTFLTGTKAKMEIDVKLQEQEENVEGYYPTNTKEEIKATLQNGSNINITSSETPVLKYGYKVTYDANLPSDCSETYSYSEIQPAYKTVELTDNTPKCEGYQFKGWETTSYVPLINENQFTMPERDITFKATWSKLDLNKTMSGTIFESGEELYAKIAEQAVLDNKSSKYVSNSNGIDFTKVSSDTNGKGVYTMSSTSSNEYPIHYYRGDINNNNVIFAGYCWEIVRTTETGGVKLIYNGEVDSNEVCVNPVFERIEYLTTNRKSLSPAGYMYNKVYEVKTGECSECYKFVQYGINGYYYIELSSGETFESALESMFEPIKDSDRKVAIDNWYKSNLAGSGSYLENTVWCYDTSIDESTLGDYYLLFNTYTRMSNGTPSLTCINATDNYTLSIDNGGVSGYGNNALTYPVGHLTSDEAMLAGNSFNATDTYLKSDISIWETIGTYGFEFDYEVLTFMNMDMAGNILDAYEVSSTYTVRPMISLKPGIEYTSGTGTPEDPYIIKN